MNPELRKALKEIPFKDWAWLKWNAPMIVLVVVILAGSSSFTLAILVLLIGGAITNYVYWSSHNTNNKEGELS